MEAVLFFGSLIVGIFGGGFVAGMVVTERYLHEHPSRWAPKRQLAKVVAFRPRAS